MNKLPMLNIEFSTFGWAFAFSLLAVLFIQNVPQIRQTLDSLVPVSSSGQPNTNGQGGFVPRQNQGSPEGILV